MTEKKESMFKFHAIVSIPGEVATIKHVVADKKTELFSKLQEITTAYEGSKILHLIKGRELQLQQKVTFKL